MKRAPFSSISLRRAFGLAAASVLVMTGCFGGDDDDASSETTLPTETTSAPTTTAAAVTTTTTPSTTTTTLVLVTEGATVVVANASGINGAAGRMSDRLEVAGFTMGDPANYTDGQLETTIVYFDADDEDAEAVAESVAQALGGGDIELDELGTPPPVDSGDLGDATVLVAMGNDTSDKSLEELQGLVVATTETSVADDSGDDDGDVDATGDDSDDTSETTEPDDG